MLVGGIFGIIGAFLAPADSSNGAQAVWAFVGVFLGLVLATIGIFGWYLLGAPYKQRNEARKRVQEFEEQARAAQTEALKGRAIGGQLQRFIAQGDACRIDYAVNSGRGQDYKDQLYIQWCEAIRVFLERNLAREVANFDQQLAVLKEWPMVNDNINAIQRWLDAIQRGL